MTLKHLCLSIFIGITFAACGGNNNSNAIAKESTDTPATVDTKDAPAVIELTTNSTISPDKEHPIIIDFNAVWCGPCRRFAPIFEEVAKEYKGKAIFMSVDVDKAPDAARQFGVTAIPQISILMPDGTIESTVGFMEKQQFLELLKEI